MKKVFTLMLGLGLVVALSSCSDEKKYKGFLEDVKEIEIEQKEIDIEILEEKIAMNEALLEMDDEDFKEAYEKTERSDSGSGSDSGSDE